MRHRKRTVKLSRTPSHRDAMLRNLVCSLIDHGKIRTSRAKAKAARTLADKAVHLAITGNGTAARRRAFQLLGNKETVKHLFAEVAGRFSKNNGGYTRIVPYGNRKGDNTDMVFFLLAYDAAEKKTGGTTMKYHFKKKRKKSKKRAQEDRKQVSGDDEEKTAAEDEQPQEEASEGNGDTDEPDADGQEDASGTDEERARAVRQSFQR